MDIVRGRVIRTVNIHIMRVAERERMEERLCSKIITNDFILL